MNDDAVIEFRDFGFKYFSQKEPTLHNINLTVHRGEKILIAGPSGCGKSTLGNCINGLIPFAYKGEITGSLKVAGMETKTASLFKLSAKVGTVLQDSDGQFIGLSVGEDIAFALENDMVPQETMKEKVKEIAGIVGMEEQIRQNPHDLSGGQKQRVSLAGVMVEDAGILLFDEPLANLDPKTGKVAIELIDEIAAADRTVIIIEHRLEDVLHRPVDRIVLLNDGRIVMDAPPDEVLASGILKEYGVREPLYLTAARYSGAKITSDMKPASLETFAVGEIKDDLQRWYDANYIRGHQEPGKNLLAVRDLQFSYDGVKPTLQDIDVVIREGEMLSIVGKNGAGKTTLASLMCGFIKPDAGVITMEGKDLAPLSISERAEYIGIVMQNPNQMISKTMIFDEVSLGLKIRGMKEEEIKEKVCEVLKICGLYEFRNWPISALSFGQKKRVTIASILVLNPKILILDEPTAGQDYRHYSEIMEFLRKLNENGQTIILITHDMHLMLEYTTRAIVISDSKKIADQKAFQVLCDSELVEAANLKETSLFELAKKAGISDPLGFVECFIHYDREVREHEN
ncbi:MAG: ABC transporter ATP-binding protein [Erysipelotrichaceae bacterium]|nr:ABC transporter ATP-binding protein [Erysipelotrichaceae bacterium]